MRIYLGLGSNLGDRGANLSRALDLLNETPLSLRRVSPVVESPALLPPRAPADWNLPFLNLVAECETDEASPDIVYAWIEGIESALGRDDDKRWSPRTIDIDILLWGQELIRTQRLTIPHPRLHERNFVLAPLIALEPRIKFPGLGEKTALDWSRELRQHIPLWMGIVNVTPDSFSDGGEHESWSAIEPHVDAMLEANTQIIDVGGESTRPGAAPISADEEWRRIEPILARLKTRFDGTRLSPSISVDTFRPETARKALDLGVDIVNDVSGLTNPEMLELASSSRADWIAMHSLSLPVDRNCELPADADCFEVVENWLLERMAAWDKAGIDLDRVIFDPGIGFGKNSLHSLELLSRAGEFRRHGLRLLIGHSRKSFFNGLVGTEIREKDRATVGVSLQLCEQGVDILRVHNVPLHATAYKGWGHASAAATRPAG